MALFGGLPEPLHRLHSRHIPLASIEGLTEFILGLDIALFCQGAENRELLGVSVTLPGVEAWQNLTGGAEQCGHKGGSHGSRRYVAHRDCF
jgi:hypothetical protein